MERWSLAEPGQRIWKNSFLSINIGQERLLPSQALDCGPALIKWLASHPRWYLSALAVLLSSTSTEGCSPEGRQWKSHSAPVQRTLTGFHQELEGLHHSGSLKCSALCSSEQTSCCMSCPGRVCGVLSLWIWTSLGTIKDCSRPTKVLGQLMSKNKFLTLWNSGSCFFSTDVQALCF